jgi:adenosine deaminase
MLEDAIRDMPKVELHVHLEGSIRPETLLMLARRNGQALPFETVEGLREWYRFIDFPHFDQIYVAITRCLQTEADLELITREFLRGQAAQNIRHSEATFTAYTIFKLAGIPFEAQLAAINRARDWALKTLDVSMALIVDIAREVTPQQGMITADWVIAAHGRGVDALGLGGYEVGHPPEKFRAAFDKARAHGVPCIPHAGETAGADSVRGALDVLGALRIGHGVRCLEDPELVARLCTAQTMLEVCPSSNVCLGVAPNLAAHALPNLLAAGLNVSINSDDPPMFNTTLNDEYLRVADTFGFDLARMRRFARAAFDASLLSAERKQTLSELFAV